MRLGQSAWAKGLLAVSVASAGFAGYAASAVPAAVAASAAAIQVRVGGDYPLVLSKGETPLLVQDRVLLPVRAVFESMGASVGYDAKSRTVLAAKGDRRVSIAIGSGTARVDGAAVRLDVPARLVGSRAYVPLRFAAAALGVDVEWHAKERTAEIVLPEVTSAVAAIEDLPEDILSAMRQRSPWETASDALYRIYGLPVSEGWADLPDGGLAARAAGLFGDDKFGPVQLYVREMESVQTASGFAFSVLVTGRDAQGRLARLGVDRIAVSTVRDTDGSPIGYMATSFAHLPWRSSQTESPIRVWLDTGMPAEAEPVPSVLPAALVDGMPGVGTRIEMGAVRSALDQAAGLRETKTTSVKGTDYVTIAELLRVWNGRTEQLPAASGSRRWRVDWQPELRQLAIHAETLARSS